MYSKVEKWVDKVSSRLIDWSPVDGWTGCLAGECTGRLESGRIRCLACRLVDRVSVAGEFTLYMFSSMGV